MNLENKTSENQSSIIINIEALSCSFKQPLWGRVETWEKRHTRGDQEEIRRTGSFYFTIKYHCAGQKIIT